MDHILLNHLKFYGYHGVFSEERTRGQKFIVDAELSLDLKNSGMSDKLEDTVSYAEVYQVIRRVMEIEQYQLLEAVAERIANDILLQFPLVKKVDITILKPNAPVDGEFDSMGIRIQRERI